MAIATSAVPVPTSKTVEPSERQEKIVCELSRILKGQKGYIHVSSDPSESNEGPNVTSA